LLFAIEYNGTAAVNRPANAPRIYEDTGLHLKEDIGRDQHLGGVESRNTVTINNINNVQTKLNLFKKDSTKLSPTQAPSQYLPPLAQPLRPYLNQN